MRFLSKSGPRWLIWVVVPVVAASLLWVDIYLASNSRVTLTILVVTTVLVLAGMSWLQRETTVRGEQTLAVLSAFPEAALLVDEAGYIQLLNAAACRLNVCTSAGVVGKRFFDCFCIVNERDERLDAAMFEATVVNAPRIPLTRYTLLRGDGRAIPVDLRASRLVADDLDLHTSKVVSKQVASEAAAMVITLRNSSLERRNESALPGAVHVFRVTPEGVISLPYASAQFLSVTGVEPSQCREDATPFMSCIPRTDANWLSAWAREHALNKQSVHIEFPLNSPVKGRIWLAWHALPSSDGQGGTLWSGLFIDVTQRKLAERSLEQSEARLQGIVDSAMDGIVTVDGHLGILLFNPAAEHMFRCSANAMIGMGLAPFVSNFLRADSVALLNMLERSEITNLRLGELSNVFGRRVGGDEFPLELAVSRSEFEGKQLLTMTLRDITERRLIAERLQLSQHQLRSALEAGDMGVIRIYFQSRQVELDQKAAELFAAEAAATAPARNWFLLDEVVIQVHPADRWRLMREYLVAVSRDAPLNTEGRIVRADKSVRWLVLRGRIEHSETGNQSTLTCIVVDITDRKRLDEQRLQAQKLESLGVLAGGIAHDFNNLLLAISGNTRLALADASANAPMLASLQEISKAATRASDLVRRILAFSRPHDQRREPVVLQAVLQDVLALARAVLPAGIAINTELVNEPLSIMADAGQIHQVVLNLLTNAADAISPGQGEIKLVLKSVVPDDRLREREPALGKFSYVLLSVIDNGSGMSPEVLDRVFDPFFTTKAVGKGTGLGLAIVRGIVKGHEGIITIDSSVGRGTQMDLYFPQVAYIEPQVAEPAVLPVSQCRGSILYVDDEEALVFLLSRVLQKAGHHFDGYTDPVRALSAFKDQPDRYYLVVSDMSMPGMSGLELARGMLAIRPEVPFIITTGFIRAEDYDAAQKAGVRQLILKPNTVEELSLAIQQILTERSDYSA